MFVTRFEAGANGAPPVVFFPLSDPGERLTQCSTSLQAMLALPRNALTPLSKLLTNYEAGEAIIQIVSIHSAYSDGLLLWLRVPYFCTRHYKCQYFLEPTCI